MKKCKMCDNAVKNNKRQYCSRTCANKDPSKKKDRNKKLEETNLRKYGTKRPAQNKDIKDKVKQTKLERYGVVSPLQTEQGRRNWEQKLLDKYGVDNPSKSNILLDKAKQTLLNTHGVNYPIQNEEIKDKIKQTNLESYGTEYAISSPLIKDKVKQTNLERYGTEYAINSPLIKNKIKQTNLERYGTEYAISSPTIREKIKQTKLERYGVVSPLQTEQGRRNWEQKLLDKYGVDNPSKSAEIRDKIKQTNLHRYDTEYHSQKHNVYSFEALNDPQWLQEQYETQSKTTQQIADELKVSVQSVCNYLHKHNISINVYYKYSMKSIMWLKHIEQSENITIQHALTEEGEYLIPCTRYKVDGYCKETNTVYEFLGDVWHGNLDIFSFDCYCHPFDADVTAGELYQHTFNRLQQISDFGYNIVFIWENDWDNIN